MIEFSKIGTSIGFKNIASKIAYDLRLWNSDCTSINKITQIATTKNNQMPPANIQSTKSNEDVWSFESGEDVLEMSLSERNECIQDVKK